MKSSLWAWVLILLFHGFLHLPVIVQGLADWFKNVFLRTNRMRSPVCMCNFICHRPSLEMLLNKCHLGSLTQHVHYSPSSGQTSHMNIIGSRISRVWCRDRRLTSRQGKRLVSSVNRGRSTKPMKPVWEDGLDTLSLSMNGETGRPSSFSMSLCNPDIDCEATKWVIIGIKHQPLTRHVTVYSAVGQQ